MQTFEIAQTPIGNCDLKSENAFILFECKTKAFLYNHNTNTIQELWSDNLHMDTVSEFGLLSDQAFLFTTNKLFIRQSLRDGKGRALFLFEAPGKVLLLDYQLYKNYERVIYLIQHSSSRDPTQNDFRINVLQQGIFFFTYQIDLSEIFSYITSPIFNSLKIMSDIFSGNGYLLISEKSGNLLILQSEFENVQYVVVEHFIIKDISIILALEIWQNFVFILLEQEVQNKRSQTLQIYKFAPPTQSGSFLKLTCSLNLDSYLLNASEKLQFKLIHSTDYTLGLINIPGSRILILKFKLPHPGFHPLQCSIIPEIVDYQHIFQESKNRIGYSFAYFHIPIDLALHGFILTPFVANSSILYFIPYCLPNYYLINGKCFRCRENSTSEGGQSKECILLNNTLAVLEEGASLGLLNHKSPHNYNCTEYLREIKAEIPELGYPIINDLGECTFNCTNNLFPDNYLGKCLSHGEVSIILDNCVQLNDCMNCSLSSSCLWFNNKCQNIEKYHKESYTKDTILDHFLLPAISCENLEQKLSSIIRLRNTSGIVAFSQRIVYRNTVVKFVIEESFNFWTSIQVNISGQPMASIRNVNPRSFIQLCVPTGLIGKECAVDSLKHWISPSKIVFTGMDISFFIWTDKTLWQNGDQVVLTYQIISSYHIIWRRLRLSFYWLCLMGFLKVVHYSICRKKYHRLSNVEDSVVEN